MKNFRFETSEIDVTTSTQFSSQYGRDMRGPEQQLMFAVLSDAIDCFQNYCNCVDGTRQRLFFDAREWIFESNNTWPFSFQNICEALDLEPDYLRAGLLAKQEKSVGQANYVAERYKRRYTPRDSRPRLRVVQVRISDAAPSSQ
jgi:hypothetical protein